MNHLSITDKFVCITTDCPKTRVLALKLGLKMAGGEDTFYLTKFISTAEKERIILSLLNHILKDDEKLRNLDGWHIT